jgi:hypothetical protein
MRANTFFNSIRIFTPILLMLVSLSLALFGQHIFDFEEAIEISPFGLIAFEHLVTETELRVTFGVFSILFLAWTFLRDYSGFYPRILKMRTMFDDIGLEKILSAYQKDPRFEFNIYSDWKKMKRGYLDNIENEIMDKVSKQVSIGDGALLAADGSTTFVVAKQALFRQAYRVVEADGQLTMQDEASGVNFLTLFHLLNTKDADIEVSLADMLFRHTFIAAPKFSQTYRFDPTNEIRFGDLVACTKARFFPAVVIGQSIYLVKGKQRWFPVAYCVYDY